MAVLVLRGADTECQPFCSEGQQLEPSLLLGTESFLRGGSKIALEGSIVIHVLVREMSRLDPRTPDVVVVGRT